jgi:hypothetical protein
MAYRSSFSREYESRPHRLGAGHTRAITLTFRHAPTRIISRLIRSRRTVHSETSRARACASKKSRCAGMILAVTTSEHLPFLNCCMGQVILIIVFKTSQLVVDIL